MSWRLEWTPHSVKDVQGIDRQVRERIVRAIEHRLVSNAAHLTRRDKINDNTQKRIRRI